MARSRSRSAHALLALVAALALLIAELPHPATAKLVTGRVSMEQGKVYELGKFSFRPPGEATVTGSVTFRSEARGALYLFVDTVWDSYRSETDACLRVKHATATLPIGTESGWEMAGRGVLRSSVGRAGSVAGESRWEFTWNIEHFVRTYGYYLVLADCGEKPWHGARFRSVKYEVSFLNPGGDQFPADEHGLFTTYLLAFLGLAAFGTYSILAKPGTFVDGYFERHAGGRAPSMARVLVTIAYVAELCSLASEIVHLWWYASNGYGIFAFDFFSEFLEGFSQTALAYLLIAFACGWTLIEGALPTKHAGPINPDALGEDSAATIFFFFIVLLTFVLQLLNKIVVFDDFTKFHDHETWAGFAHVLVRTGLAVTFSFQIYNTISYQSRRGGGGSRGVRFLRTLALLGGLWFWCFPLLVVIASLFAHYLRHRIVTGGVLVLQSSSLVLLVRQITNQSSAYAKANVGGGGAALPVSQKGA